ncbi:ribosomal protection-like ABC-F family protein [Pseudalkalibacillus berkeleyi]|uniref:ABC-F type ribosomal protection protein n=1 Tax=Pseudalkalibacillus berkeleyi TaxID=1069813 RepID=A0ABS9H509_9BACL|nr:ABC-F type ribosomal protection protein [Pseudalkalibacillus berkeleyi]MCF6139034.1 ABC-F type ribosomal protection protein [Pseudalkalibacillus berkeleyi]
MLILKAVNIGVEIEGKTIFENANIEIHKGDHVALVGRNGVGKTTLIKCLMGETLPTYGSVHHYVKKESWGVVCQEAALDGDMTARSFVELETQPLYEAKQQLLQSEKMLQNCPEDAKRIHMYNQALQTYLDLDGYDWESSVEQYLRQLGISEALWEVPFDQLSGGQKTRAKLARVIQRDPDCLLLDEPTNHLDAETIEWLADWLRAYKGTVLFISHERAFIDHVANVTYELSYEGTKKYVGGYTEYKRQKDHEFRSAEAAYQKQQAERNKLMEAVTNYRQWFQKAHDAASERDPFAKKKANKNMTRLKAKEAALERLEANKVKKPEQATGIHVDLVSQAFNSRTFARFEDVSFGYEAGVNVLEGMTFTIERGDRIAVVGKNGTGKTTLLKLMTGALQPTSGNVQHHPNLQTGFFMQELEGLQGDGTVLDQILHLPGMTQSDARTILACFLFKGDTVYKKLKDLSMGEKCRVAFVKLYFSNANLLVLDEPTNYLDIETRERIEDALEWYQGAVVMVSHDPYMLEKVSNRVLTLDDGFYDYRDSYQNWKQHHRRSTETQHIHNEIERLKLELSNLINQEMNTDEEEDLMGQMQALHKRIEQLKSTIN